MYEDMLIDARNAAYRAIYAGLSDPIFMANKTDFIVIYFRFISTYIRKFKPKNVHFFWDAPKEEIWRRKIHPEYKDGRKGHSDKEFDFDAALQRLSEISDALMPVINCRSFLQDRQEADDLIYAFCRLKRTGKIMIVSSDKDFRQIPHMMSNVDCYSPMAKEDPIYKPEGEDPVDIKCFTGEKTDNIEGYYQIGPVKAGQLVADYKKRIAFLEQHGWERYQRNRVLADLSLCPYVLSNMSYIQSRLAFETTYDGQKIQDVIQKYQVKGLRGEVNNTILPFKFLGKAEE